MLTTEEHAIGWLLALVGKAWEDGTKLRRILKSSQLPMEDGDVKARDASGTSVMFNLKAVGRREDVMDQVLCCYAGLTSPPAWSLTEVLDGQYRLARVGIHVALHFPLDAVAVPQRGALFVSCREFFTKMAKSLQQLFLGQLLAASTDDARVGCTLFMSSDALPLEVNGQLEVSAQLLFPRLLVRTGEQWTAVGDALANAARIQADDFPPFAVPPIEQQGACLFDSSRWTRQVWGLPFARSQDGVVYVPTVVIPFDTEPLHVPRGNVTPDSGHFSDYSMVPTLYEGSTSRCWASLRPGKRQRHGGVYAAGADPAEIDLSTLDPTRNLSRMLAIAEEHGLLENFRLRASCACDEDREIVTLDRVSPSACPMRSCNGDVHSRENIFLFIRDKTAVYLSCHHFSQESMFLGTLPDDNHPSPFNASESDEEQEEGGDDESAIMT